MEADAGGPLPYIIFCGDPCGHLTAGPAVAQCNVSTILPMALEKAYDIAVLLKIYVNDATR
jgi:hypothetical protein